MVILWWFYMVIFIWWFYRVIEWDLMVILWWSNGDFYGDFNGDFMVI